MKKLFTRRLLWLAVVIVLVVRGGNAWGQTWLSAVQAPTGSTYVFTQFATPQQSVRDAVGNVYVVGTFRGAVQFGTTALTTDTLGEALFVAKLSPAGSWQWAVSTGAPSTFGNFSGGRGIALDPSGNVLITGTYRGALTLGSTTLPTLSTNVSAVLVAKLSPAGAWLWATSSTAIAPTGRSTMTMGTGVAVDATGNVLITGDLNGTHAFGTTTLPASASEMFVARLSPAGAWQWAVGSTGNTSGPFDFDQTHATKIAVDGTGNALVTGEFAHALTLGTSTLTRSATTGWELFVGKVSPAGTVLWVAGAPSTGNSRGDGITVDGSGNVVLAGCFTATTTFGTTALTSGSVRNGFVARLNPTGSWQWALNSRGSATRLPEDAYRLAVDPGDNILLAGTTEDTVLSNGRFLVIPYVTRINPAGTWQWRAEAAKGNGHSYGYIEGLSLASNGDAVITGAFSGSLVFGPATLISADSNSFFVARLTNNPLATPSFQQASALTISPNPARETVLLSSNTENTVVLLDALGRTVRTYPPGTTTLDLGGLAPGLYTVRAGAVTRRLVVE